MAFSLKKPRRLRPIPREYRLWFMGTIIFFVTVCLLGWYFTSAQIVKQMFRFSGESVSESVTQTKQYLGEKNEVKENVMNIKKEIGSFLQNSFNEANQKNR